MRFLFAFLLLAIAAPAWSQPTCPAQGTSIIASGGRIHICSTETVESVEVEVNGAVDPANVFGPLVAGITGGPFVVAGACADVTLRGRGVNVAGAGPWGAPVAATFPPCTAPVLLSVP